VEYHIHEKKKENKMKKEKTIKRKRLLNNTTGFSALLVVFFMIMSSGVYAIQMAPSRNTVLIQQNSSLPAMDISPHAKSEGVQPLELRDDVWDLQFSFDLELASGGDRNYGAGFDGTYFYSARWNAARQHQYDRTGTLITGFSIGQYPTKDLAYDGTYFYGGAEGEGNSFIYKMDFINKTLISTIPVEFHAQAIAYNGDLDVFYCSDYGDPVYVVDRSGTIVDQFNLVTTISTSGLAYDNVSPGGPYLWVFDQGNGPGYPQYIYQWNLSAGSFTGVRHDVTLDFPMYSVAGGLFFTTSFTGGSTLVGCLQGTPDIMFCYEPPNSSWGYNVGVREILAPTDGPVFGAITPEVTVKNYGTSPESDVPVRMTIDRFIPGSSPVEYMNEDFSSWVPAGWTQSGPFNQSFTNNAGGFCPETHVGFLEYTGFDWIQSPAVNATTASALTLSFRTSINHAQAQNSFYVKTRRDASDPWTDRTPWSNPPPDTVNNQYNIDISDDIGPGTQVNFSVIGETGFMHDWYIDDVMFIQPAGPGSYVFEYNETVSVNLSVDVTVNVVFPEWTPSALGVSENVNIDYWVEAGTLLHDDFPGNDWKSENITLHFPYFHDAMVVDVQPITSGPGQSQEVKARVKNFGLNPEGDFFTNVQIGTLQTGTSIYSDNFSINNWTRRGNWHQSSSSHADGTSPEYRFTGGSGIHGIFYLISPPINTTSHTFGILSFKHLVADIAFDYTLAVETSTDGGITWERIWEVPGGFRGPEVVKIPLMLGSSALRIAFVYQGYPAKINSWYMDDVEISAASFVAEYSEDAYVPPGSLDPGEEVELVFPDWTPMALAAGVSGDVTYLVQGQTRLPGDTNPGNNISTSLIDLGWWHDVEVQKEPPHGVIYAFDVISQEFFWFTDPEVVHTIGPNTSPYLNLMAGTWADINGGTWYTIGNDWNASETLLYTVNTNDGTMTLIGSGEPDGPFKGIAYDDTTSTMYAITGNPDQLYTIDLSTGAVTLVADLSQSIQDIAIDNDGNCYGYTSNCNICSINLNNGYCTLIGSTGINYVSHGVSGIEYDKVNDILYVTNTFLWGYDTLFTCNVTTGRVTPVGSFPTDYYPLQLAIPYTIQPPPRKPSVFYKPGTYYPVSAIVENLGTFPETGLTASAYLYEYISDPNGTLVYTDSITDISLDPLGDEESLTFDSYDFTLEGVYGLNLELPLLSDDKPLNNHVAVPIGIDDTPPTSTYALTPSTPTGQNDWYVNQIIVTLSGDDGTELFQSGVNHINYQINDGSIQSIPSGGSFILSADGYYTVSYWAMDNVGN
jgi:hypothetical protein